MLAVMVRHGVIGEKVRIGFVGNWDLRIGVNHSRPNAAAQIFCEDTLLPAQCEAREMTSGWKSSAQKVLGQSTADSLNKTLIVT